MISCRPIRQKTRRAPPQAGPFFLLDLLSLARGIDGQLPADPGEDELLPKAIEIAMELKQISASFLQRKLGIGYNRAARLIDQMEERGIIGGKDGSNPRQVLVTK